MGLVIQRLCEDECRCGVGGEVGSEGVGWRSELKGLVIRSLCEDECRCD